MSDAASQPCGTRDVDALLYDFGGVLVQINFDWVFERWAELAAAPFGEVKRRFKHGEAYQRHERGEIDLEEYYRFLRQELGIDLTDAQLTDGWQRVFGPEYPQVVQLMQRLEGRVPQYAFSNTNHTHYEFFRKRHAAALTPLRRIFVSCEMGRRKPEREAFEHVSQEIGVPLDRILFLDDTVANLVGASELGIRTVQVRSPDDVARAVAPWLD